MSPFTVGLILALASMTTGHGHYGYGYYGPSNYYSGYKYQYYRPSSTGGRLDRLKKMTFFHLSLSYLNIQLQLNIPKFRIKLLFLIQPWFFLIWRRKSIHLSFHRWVARWTWGFPRMVRSRQPGGLRQCPARSSNRKAQRSLWRRKLSLIHILYK